MDHQEFPQQCQDIREQFSTYLDGELPEAKMAEISAHLASCPVCRQEWQRFQEIWDLLAWPLESAPAHLAPQILDRLAARPLSRWTNLALAASFLIGIFLGGRIGLGLYETRTMALAPTEAGVVEILADLPADSLSSLWLADQGETDNGS